MASADATETFRLSVKPLMEMYTPPSAIRLASSETPSRSFPKMTAVGTVQSYASSGWPPSNTVTNTRYPRRFKSSIA